MQHRHLARSDSSRPARSAPGWVLALTCLVLAAAPSIARAQAISFLHTGVGGSGMIGTTSFVDRNFTITATGDVGSRQTAGAGHFIDHLTATIDIEGIGSFDFLTGTRTFVNNSSSRVGFSRAGASGGDLYSGPGTVPALATWDMTTSIGPLPGQTSFLQWTLTPVETSGGVLAFNSGFTTGTFTATVGPVTTVPEPSTVLLMAGGLAALGIAARGRSRASD